MAKPREVVFLGIWLALKSLCPTMPFLWRNAVQDGVAINLQLTSGAREVAEKLSPWIKEMYHARLGGLD